MITPRIKPSAFFARRPVADLFVQEQREGKLSSYVAKLAAMDGMIDFAAVVKLTPFRGHLSSQMKESRNAQI